jgi:hypothetical protein
VADPPGSDVGLGSVTIACDEVIDDRVDCACELDAAAVVEVELGGVVANDHDGGATELVPVLDVAVVCACDLVVMVTTSTPGHSELENADNAGLAHINANAHPLDQCADVHEPLYAC